MFSFLQNSVHWSQARNGWISIWFTAAEAGITRAHSGWCTDRLTHWKIAWSFFFQFRQVMYVEIGHTCWSVKLYSHFYSQKYNPMAKVACILVKWKRFPLPQYTVAGHQIWLLLYLVSPFSCSSIIASHVSSVFPPMAECIRNRSTYETPNLYVKNKFLWLEYRPSGTSKLEARDGKRGHQRLTFDTYSLVHRVLEG